MNEIWWLIKSGQREKIARARVVEEGGEILSCGSIGLLFVDPFKHSTPDASSHCIRVRYRDRCGTWFVRTSSKRPEGEWLWVDDYGTNTLPVPRSDDSRVVDRVGRIPAWALLVPLIVILVGVFMLT